MQPTNDQFPRLLDEARRVPATEREAWVAALPVSAEVKQRLTRALNEDVTIDLKAPVGEEPDIAVQLTRGATLSEPDTKGVPSSNPSTTMVRGASAVDPLIGRTFAGVVVEKILGSGGMGRVYLGTDGPGGKAVALKVLLRTQRDDNVRRRFDREARLLQKLRHPCIASVLRTGVEEDGDIDIPYIVMEHVEGALSVTDFVFKQRLGMRDICQMYLQVCEAVGAAHSQGYMHRDLKPANILVNRQGRVKVIDFGVARAVQVDSAAVTVRTETGQLVGTMQYMSPEQFKADPRGIDKRSDVYALAAVLYELLTGIQPHDLRGLPVHEAARIVCDSNAPDVRQCNPHVDAKLASLLADGLSRDVAQRPDDAQSFGRRLKSWLSVPAPTIEATIHPVHPDMDSCLKTVEENTVSSVHGVRLQSRRPITAIRPPRAKNRGGWGGVTVITVLVVLGVLVGFDIVPVKKMVERVQQWTRTVSSAAASDAPAAEADTAADSKSKSKGGKSAKAAPPPPPPVAKTALEQVRVVTAPAGAAIKVNGEAKGVSPALVFTELNSGGSVQIEASMDGWQTAGTTWAVKDGPLVAFNLVPTEDGDAIQRLFVLEISDLAKGSTITLTAPETRELKSGAEAVAVDFSKVNGQWQAGTITLTARDAKGKPAEIQIGARRGVGSVTYEVKPEDARNKLKIRVK